MCPILKIAKSTIIGKEAMPRFCQLGQQLRQLRVSLPGTYATFQS